ncbi:serpentine type 7TM GPCR chemoreceptor str domain-containing protein [Ditylenchus destructor]|nr:serpentine type 7TM GPCR chemoreceptor str domain-containing protein [Ditylenchus destructor]
MDTIHHVIDTIINTISVFLNGLLLYLVLNYSSFHVPKYKYLLTVASVNDIVLGLAVLYGQPVRLVLKSSQTTTAPNGWGVFHFA